MMIIKSIININIFSFFLFFFLYFLVTHIFATTTLYIFTFALSPSLSRSLVRSLMVRSFVIALNAITPNGMDLVVAIAGVRQNIKKRETNKKKILP